MNQNHAALPMYNYSAHLSGVVLMHEITNLYKAVCSALFFIIFFYWYSCSSLKVKTYNTLADAWILNSCQRASVVFQGAIHLERSNDCDQVTPWQLRKGRLSRSNLTQCYNVKICPSPEIYLHIAFSLCMVVSSKEGCGLDSCLL